MSRVALTADSLSLGDLVDKKIRSNMAWSLLPTQAIFSSVLPGEYMEGQFVGQINFPGWLGKNSKASKRKRLAQEIHDHTRIRTSGSRSSVRLDYAPFLVNALVGPLKERGTDGVHESLEVIKQYRLLREDIESLLELTTWPRKKNPWEEIDGKVKAALTRAYNKEVAPYSYSINAGIKKKKAEALDDMDGLEGEEGETQPADSDEDDEKDDDLENNAFIKVKKPTKAAASKSDSKKSAPSSSKPKVTKPRKK
jgi:replication factor C subunit 1